MLVDHDEGEMATMPSAPRRGGADGTSRATQRTGSFGYLTFIAGQWTWQIHTAAVAKKPVPTVSAIVRLTETLWL